MDNISVQPFKFKHFKHFIDMLSDREDQEAKTLTMKALPRIGYIAMIDEQPIAAGFLRLMEGNEIAQIEYVASNPYFGSIIRHKGLDKVLKSLIKDAKDMKIKVITAFTADDGTFKRAQELGFKVVEVVPLVMSLD